MRLRYLSFLVVLLHAHGCFDQRAFNNPVELDRDNDGLPGAFDCDDSEASVLGCPNGSPCLGDRGCLYEYCVAGICTQPTCDDGVINQGETGLDCGGANCQGCPLGGSCRENLDCQSLRCLQGICEDPCPNPRQTGVNCDVCAPQFSGLNCQDCANPNTSPEDCLTCLPQFTGPACAECTEPDRFTGEACNECANPLMAPPECMTCVDQELTGPSCDICVNPYRAAPTCTACLDPQKRGPNCDLCANPGRTGLTCDQCVQPKQMGDECEACANPKHDIDSGCMTCRNDALFWPNCTSCMPGFVGPFCAACSDSGKTGPDCTLCAGMRTTGETCSDCASGYGGPDCRFSMGASGVTLNDASSNIVYAALDDIPYRGYDEAVAHCAAMTTLGLTDWRLPTAAELEVLHDSEAPPVYDPITMPGVQLSPGERLLFWTDSFSEAQGAGLVIDLMDQSTWPHAAADLANVLCVYSSSCGDTVCTGRETFEQCSTDCEVPWAECGDGICSVGETASACLADCGGACGDGICAVGETSESCDADCCISACEGKGCGEDGCGGLCGTCSDGTFCSDQDQCMPNDMLSLGLPCTSALDCGDSSFVTCLTRLDTGEELPGGYCAYRCDPLGSCAHGQGRCWTVEYAQWCLDGCFVDSDCRAGYRCDNTDRVCLPNGVSLCLPDCDGKVCGDDGCGGSCGECPDGLVCNGFHECAVSCTPSCNGAQCGNDGCGGSCGSCEPGDTCLDGLCCTPMCAGNPCGDDGCGGQCNECSGDLSCDSFGQCVEDCTPDCDGAQCGDDGCAGTCGNCASGLTCVNGECIDLSAGDVCVDSANGATDFFGESCDDYIGRPSFCGAYDDDDFQAAMMCCACGGGVGGAGCGSGLMVNCIGGCTTLSWLGDGYCDYELDCAATNYDAGDCVP